MKNSPFRATSHAFSRASKKTTLNPGCPYYVLSSASTLQSDQHHIIGCVLQVNLLIEPIASSSEGTSTAGVGWWSDWRVCLHTYSESSNDAVSVQVQRLRRQTE